MGRAVKSDSADRPDNGFDAGITVEGLLDRIRSEIARRRRNHPPGACPPTISLVTQAERHTRATSWDRVAELYGELLDEI
jgi:hypothetical protein